MTLRPLPIVAAGCLGFTVALYVFQPGYLSNDSITQLGEARSGHFTDWHPPLMSWVWRSMDKVHRGPLGMLLLHNVMFWSGLCLLAALSFGSRWAAAGAVLLIGSFPPVFALLGTIWKDVGMAAALLLAVAVLVLAERHRRPWPTVAIVPGLLFYAVGVRYNGVFAALPLCVWTMSILVRDVGRFDRHRVTIAAISGLALLLTLFAATRITHRLIVDQRLFPSQQVLVHDLVGISTRTDHNQLPGFVQGEVALSLADLQRIYTPRSVSRVYWGDTSTRRLRDTVIGNDDDFNRLAGHWRGVVLQHPREYFAHRSAVTSQLLALGPPEVCLPFITGVVSNTLGVHFQPNRVNAGVTRRLERFQNTFLFRPGYYLIAGLLMLAALPFLARRDLLPPAGIVLLASGILYALPYYFIGTTCDFRMVWWSVIAIVLAAMTMLGALLHR